MKKIAITVTALSLLVILTSCDGVIYANGIVRDANGSPIEDAQIRLHWEEGWESQESTDENGCFEMNHVVSPGDYYYAYNLEVSKTGFKTAHSAIETLVSNGLAKNIIVVILVPIDSLTDSMVTILDQAETDQLSICE